MASSEKGDRCTSAKAAAPRWPAAVAAAIGLCMAARPAGGGSAGAAGGSRGRIPSLTWTRRSDWVDVQLRGAVGDGKADDTAALQRAFDGVRSGSTVYLPAGVYRVTRLPKLFLFMPKLMI